MKKYIFTLLVITFLLSSCSKLDQDIRPSESTSVAEESINPIESKIEVKPMAQIDKITNEKNKVIQIYASEPEKYIYSYIFSANGDLLLEGKYITVLRDVHTNIPIAITQRQPEIDEEASEPYNVVADFRSILYDLEGNILRDWEDGVYDHGFNNWIIKCEQPNIRYASPAEQRGSLIDINTGEEIIAGATKLTRIDDRYIGVSKGQYLQAVIDRKGDIVKTYAPEQEISVITAPLPTRYLSFTLGGFSVYDTNVSILDEDFELIQTIPPNMSTYISGHKGRFVQLYGNEGNYVVDLNDGTLAISILKNEGNKHLDYYDGTISIVADQNEYYIADTQLNRISETYDRIIAVSNEANTSARIFAIKNKSIYELDKDAKVIKEKTVDNLSDGAVFFYVDTIEGIQAGDQCYNLDLEPIDEGFPNILDRNLPYQLSSITFKNGVERIKAKTDAYFDLYTMDGELIGKNYIEKTMFIMDAREKDAPEFLRVVQGNKVGLIDSSGNWIGQVDIHTELDD